MKVSKRYTTVTPLSKTIALILFIALPFAGFFLGMSYQRGLDVAFKDADASIQVILSPSPSMVTDVSFSCSGSKTIQVLFHSDKVELTLSDGRHFALPQVISGSGARYANSNESFVFWNKGTTAFVTEGNTTTYQNCVEKSK